MELAEWIASPANPLTARVMVNRIWQHHFGEGIVRTPNNFGKLGTPPTHPELLDHLATQFVQARLVDQGDAPRDHAVGGVPAVEHRRRRDGRRPTPTTCCSAG